MYHTTLIAEDHLRAIDQSRIELQNVAAEKEMLLYLRDEINERLVEINNPEPSFKEKANITAPWNKLFKDHFHL